MRLALLLVLVLLMACGEQPAVRKAKQPDLLSRATRDRVVLHVYWGADGVRDNCASGQEACCRRRLIGEEWHAYLYAVEPWDFNDIDRLATLGHETWHAVGAEHKEL